MAARKSKGVKPTGRKVRNLRHWKQQFNADAAFIARKRLNLSCGVIEPGEILPQEAIDDMGRTKLKRFWAAKRIELAQFEPTQAFGIGTPELDTTAKALDEANAEAAALIEEITAEAIIDVDGPEPTGEE